MTEESPRRRARISDWLKKQGTWFWACTITLGLVLTLFVGSQIARDTGQDVDWYTGFGQWLGGIGSIIAAGVALWIATEDRRREVQREEAATQLRDADLAREAGLVRVALELAPAGLYEESFSRLGIVVKNRRSTRIFEIKVARFTVDGQELVADGPEPRAWVKKIGVAQCAQGRFEEPDLIPVVALNSDDSLHVFPDWESFAGFDRKRHQEFVSSFVEAPSSVVMSHFVEIEYTDSAGRRWSVDSDGTVKRF